MTYYHRRDVTCELTILLASLGPIFKLQKRTRLSSRLYVILNVPKFIIRKYIAAVHIFAGCNFFAESI